MISPKYMHTEQLLVVAAAAIASLASTACATSATTARDPALALDAAPYHVSSPPACRIDGSTRVVGTKIAPSAGVQAEADSSKVMLRFARRPETRPLALVIDPESFDVSDESQPGFPVLALGAAPARSASREAVQVRWRAPSAEPVVGQHPIPLEAATLEAGDRRMAGPIVARVDSDRSIWAWTAGSIYKGLDVLVLTVGEHGRPLGAPVILAHAGSAIGLPTVAVAPSGHGVVAFVDSNDSGFELVAAALDCTGFPQESPAPWAMRAAR